MPGLRVAEIQRKCPDYTLLTSPSPCIIETKRTHNILTLAQHIRNLTLSKRNTAGREQKHITSRKITWWITCSSFSCLIIKSTVCHSVSSFADPRNWLQFVLKCTWLRGNGYKEVWSIFQGNPNNLRQRVQNTLFLEFSRMQLLRSSQRKRKRHTATPTLNEVTQRIMTSQSHNE